MGTSRLVEYIVNWLTTYVEASGMNGFTIGVSGGIDSAVVSSLCAKTGKQVLVLNMPIFQAKDQEERASAHIARLMKHHGNVTGVDMDLTPVFEQMQKSFPGEIQDGLTMANTRSRLRMLTLYAFASHHRMLVTGTGNKVEDFGVGFFTKYGDGGVDISPIGDLGKSQVYALGKTLGIHQDILKAAPTDGLWEDQRTDESQMGATYGELEWAMAHEEASKASGQASEENLDARKKEVLAIYRKLHKANQHKMMPIPVCTIPLDLI